MFDVESGGSPGRNDSSNGDEVVMIEEHADETCARFGGVAGKRGSGEERKQSDDGGEASHDPGRTARQREIIRGRLVPASGCRVPAVCRSSENVLRASFSPP